MSILSLIGICRYSDRIRLHSFAFHIITEQTLHYCNEFYNKCVDTRQGQDMRVHAGFCSHVIACCDEQCMHCPCIVQLKVNLNYSF
jgi:hypothetical protein